MSVDITTTTHDDERAELTRKFQDATATESFWEIRRQLVAARTGRQFSPEEDEHANKCVAALSSPHRTYLALRLQGLSYQKIAAETGSSAEAVLCALTAFYADLVGGIR